MVSAMILIVAISSSAAFAATSVVNNKKYTHPAFYKASLHKLFHGVDVSVWQGSINWKKSKKDGIDFAILRCGYTALNSFSLHQDSTFTTNYTNAKKAGVSVGIYYYACATTKKEAKKEANYVISILKNNNVNNQLPVVMDYEINAGRPNTVYNKLVKSKGKAYARDRFTTCAKQFMNVLRASGYETMFYSYRALIDPKFSANYRFNMDEINGSSQYRFWLAQYSTSNSYSGKMEIWQFSSTGKVKGMSGNIDRNFWYYPLSGVKTTSGTKSIRDCKVTLSASQYKYDGNIKEPSVTVKDGSDKLKNGTDYSVSYMNNIKKGTATVLVHGKGDYSNETYSTFKIGDKDDNSNKTTVVDDEVKEEEAATPAKVKGFETKANLSKGKLKLTWDKADNATRYQVVYKVNNAEKMTRVNTDKTSYTLDGLDKGSLVEVLIRGQNVVDDKVTNGKYSTRKYLYMATTDGSAAVKADNKVKVTWDAANTPKKLEGTVKYKVVMNCVDVVSNDYTTEKTKITIDAKNRYCYNVAVRPTYELDGHTYTGTYGKVSHVYVTYGKIKKLTAIKGGFKVTYKKTEGIGNPKYKISYSTNSKLKKAESKTKAQDKTTCTVKKLKSGKKYYVAVQSYKVLHDITYYGVMSDIQNVVTK